MMRTDAPKDLEGRGFVNLARTTPELPVRGGQFLPLRFERSHQRHTVWPRHLAPDHADLGSTDLLLAPIDISDLLAEIEAVVPVNSHSHKIQRQAVKRTWQRWCRRRPQS